EQELGEDGQPRKRRRRGRRGGRRNKRRQEGTAEGDEGGENTANDSYADGAENSDGEDLSLEDEADPLASGEAPALLSYSRGALEAEDPSDDDEETWEAVAATEGAYDEPEELLEAEAEVKEELAREEAAEEAEEGETTEETAKKDEPAV
ncbi:MAG TPA: ribonuclease E/G, partial [Rhodobiaceae bacterium]|nr:ribonuclease E/G [Rhodobiaceae bacterium]